MTNRYVLFHLPKTNVLAAMGALSIATSTHMFHGSLSSVAGAVTDVCAMHICSIGVFAENI
jgi:hypothetical protein